MPRVSVLVPCFNDERYLDEALSSIAAQTCGDFEVIVSDDASADSSPAIAEQWAKRDPRFRLVRNEQNLGMTRNWNRALQEARGRFVAKLDADDAWEPGLLAALTAELETERLAIAAFSRAVDCDANLNPTGAWSGEQAFELAKLDPARRSELSGHFWLELSFEDRQLWHSCSFLVRRSELSELGGWDERWSCASDTDLILRLLETGRPVIHVPYVGVRYRRREDSVSARAGKLGWKSVEAILVPLESLARQESRRPVSATRLRRNWWRLWSALQRLRRKPEPWNAAPATVGPTLREVADRLERPPVRIRMEGLLRDGVCWLRSGSRATS